MVYPFFCLPVLYERLAVEEIVPACAVLECGLSIDEALHDISEERVHGAGLVRNVRQQKVEFVGRVVQGIGKRLESRGWLQEAVWNTRCVAARQKIANVLEGAGL